jgi:pyruvate/2-oxoglutarate dehydrogenase complex dihydrolipoamide acyltransferase (E2) component
MKKKPGYTSIPLSFNRRAVIASASVNKGKSTFHAITETDISIPRALMEDQYQKTGEKPSLTAYVVCCLSRTLKNHPQLNSFRRKNRLVILDGVTVNVLVEREYLGETVPESFGISEAQNKSVLQVQREIREARQASGKNLGSLSGMTWVRFIPPSLIRTFFRIADRDIRLGIRYGKVAVTSIGMFSREPVWFVPHGTATVLVAIGGIVERVIPVGNGFESREHLCLTVSFDHDIVDGAPAARFMKDFLEEVRSGALLDTLK